ncbi:inhibitor of apoptosis-promoting Bax1-domain-containing protein [Pyronema omphalodes]|nr:inhibitor of apoptosis-promoting Bax1-domain-containing protein [Pyronema omphalodes]
MAAPKYAPVPTSEPVDGPSGPQNYYGAADPTSNYTRPPPSYQDDENLLRGGVPRSSEDNIPDDFKFGGMVSEATLDIRQAFIRKVYAILTVQLAATAALSGACFWSNDFKGFIQTNTWMMILSMIGSFIFLGLTWWKSRSYPMNLVFLSCFTLMEAYTVAVVTSFYDSRIVLQAVFITGALFLALTLFACQTSYDITAWGGYLYGALVGLVIFGFVGLFFQSSMVELVYSAGIAVVFSAYIMFDTQMIMRKCHVEEEIMAAISLYLDIINLFLAILRILNSANDS